MGILLCLDFLYDESPRNRDLVDDRLDDCRFLAVPSLTPQHTIASAGEDGLVCLWDPDSGDNVTTLKGHRGSVWSVAWDGGNRLASAGSDGTVRLWNPDSGAAMTVFEGHQGGVFSVAWSSTDNLLASAGTDGAVRLWDPNNGSRLASTGSDGTVRLWDVYSSTAVATFEGYRGAGLAVAWSAEGSVPMLSPMSAVAEDVLAVFRGEDPFPRKL